MSISPFHGGLVFEDDKKPKAKNSHQSQSQEEEKTSQIS